jgi:hypothetical protein
MRRSAVQYYKTLNDAAKVTGNDDYEDGNTQIWYQKSDFARDGMMGLSWLAKLGKVPHPGKLNQTHVLLGNIRERNPEKIYEMMQANNWSPVGEARLLIQSKGIDHTSMSVGDIVIIGGKTLFVDISGFKDMHTYHKQAGIVERLVEGKIEAD